MFDNPIAGPLLSIAMSVIAQGGAHRADYVRQVCGWYRDHIRGFLETFAPKRLDELDRDLKRIEALQEQLGGECAVCFVGHSGVGKSTLINTLVDDTRSILPQGGVGPLTAQATSVRWADTPCLEATYLPPGSLNRLLFSLERHHEHRQRSSESATEPASAESLDMDPEDRDEAACDATDAVAEAGPRRIDALVRQARLLVRGTPDAEIDITYLADCLRAALGQAARHGHEPTADDAPRVESLRRALRLAKEKQAHRREGHVKDRDFLDDLRLHAAGHLAPLIGTLDVGWDSRILSDGLALVDLPGLGIANDQYREVTQRWTREKAAAVALVVDRSGITRDTAELLRASGFLGRLLHAADDPSADPVCLLVVAVKLDLTADDEWRRERDDHPDNARPWTKHFEVVQQQMEMRLRSQVKDQIVGALRQSASDAAAEVDQVAERLMSDLAIHVVSALQFRKLARADHEDPARIREAEESGMPELAERLQALASSRDALLKERIASAADQFGERILGTLAVVRAQDGDGTREDDDNLRMRAELHSFLFGPSGPGTQLRARQGAFREFLSQTGTQGIQDTVAKAGHAAEKSIRGYLDDLGLAHWATLRAAVRRGGAFIGARTIDLPNEFAVRIDEPVGLVWSKTILASVRKRTTELGKDHERFVNRVADWALEHAAADPTKIKAIQKQTGADIVALDMIGREQVDELRRRVRQQLLQRIGSAIRRKCRSFVDAGHDVGRGVKHRILDLFDDLVPMVMKTARETAVKVLRSNYQAVERDIRDAFDACPDPIENVSEVIAPTERTDPALRCDLLTRIDEITADAPGRTLPPSGNEQHAVSQLQ